MKIIKTRKGEEIIVDDEDFDFLSKYTWHLGGGGRRYVKMSIQEKGRTCYMARMLMKPSKDKQVDHINLNPLDNRKSNLRVCTSSQNSRNRNKYKNNTTGYKGILFNKKTKTYTAVIRVSRHGFKTAEDASKEYDKLAKIFYKDYAKLNGE